MRRALMTSFAVGGIVLGAAAPAAADPPSQFRDSGPYEYLFSVSEDCREQGGGSTVCDAVYLDVYTLSDDLVSVCLYTETYVLRGNRYSSRNSEFGCTEVDGSEFTVTDRFVATLSDTTVTLSAGDSQGQGREVTVSAEDSPTGEIRTVSGRSSFRDGTCTYRSSFTERVAEVEGTITLDGVTLEESGSVGTGTQTTVERCR